MLLLKIRLKFSFWKLYFIYLFVKKVQGNSINKRKITSQEINKKSNFNDTTTITTPRLEGDFDFEVVKNSSISKNDTPKALMLSNLLDLFSKVETDTDANVPSSSPSFKNITNETTLDQIINIKEGQSKNGLSAFEEEEKILNVSNSSTNNEKNNNSIKIKFIVTDIILFVLVILIILSYYYIKKKKNKKSYTSTPTTITTIEALDKCSPYSCNSNNGECGNNINNPDHTFLFKKWFHKFKRESLHHIKEENKNIENNNNCLRSNINGQNKSSNDFRNSQIISHDYKNVNYENIIINSTNLTEKSITLINSSPKDIQDNFDSLNVERTPSVIASSPIFMKNKLNQFILKNKAKEDSIQVAIQSQNQISNKDSYESLEPIPNRLSQNIKKNEKGSDQSNITMIDNTSNEATNISYNDKTHINEKNEKINQANLNQQKCLLEIYKQIKDNKKSVFLNPKDRALKIYDDTHSYGIDQSILDIKEDIETNKMILDQKINNQNEHLESYYINYIRKNSQSSHETLRSFKKNMEKDEIEYSSTHSDLIIYPYDSYFNDDNKTNSTYIDSFSDYSTTNNPISTLYNDNISNYNQSDNENTTENHTMDIANYNTTNNSIISSYTTDDETNDIHNYLFSSNTDSISQDSVISTNNTINCNYKTIIEEINENYTSKILNNNDNSSVNTNNNTLLHNTISNNSCVSQNNNLNNTKTESTICNSDIMTKHEELEMDTLIESHYKFISKYDYRNSYMTNYSMKGSFTKNGIGYDEETPLEIYIEEEDNFKNEIDLSRSNLPVKKFSSLYSFNTFKSNHSFSSTHSTIQSINTVNSNNTANSEYSFKTYSTNSSNSINSKNSTKSNSINTINSAKTNSTFSAHSSTSLNTIISQTRKKYNSIRNSSFDLFREIDKNFKKFLKNKNSDAHCNFSQSSENLEKKRTSDVFQNRKSYSKSEKYKSAYSFNGVKDLIYSYKIQNQLQNEHQGNGNDWDKAEDEDEEEDIHSLNYLSTKKPRHSYVEDFNSNFKELSLTPKLNYGFKFKRSS